MFNLFKRTKKILAENKKKNKESVAKLKEEFKKKSKT